MNELDLQLSDGRSLHAYDTGTESGHDRLVVVWHHGTPNIGLPPEPLFPTSDRLGIRWVSYDRPRYGGSSPLEGRAEWLARRIPSAELLTMPDDGHISVLNHGASALEWLREHAGDDHGA